MIIDGHCHIWENWPYQPPVPDGSSRARAEQLLYEMDGAGVERAVLICARIGDNPRNVDYAFEAAGAHPGRFVVFPDIDCRWSADYRQPGAAKRLEEALARWDLRGFTHYIEEAEDGTWLSSDEGIAFFGVAAERRLVPSLSVLPLQVAAVIDLARRFPGLQILLHHFGFLGPRTEATPGAREMVLARAGCSNIHVKYSGIGNVAATGRSLWPIITQVATAEHRAVEDACKELRSCAQVEAVEVEQALSRVRTLLGLTNPHLTNSVHVIATSLAL
jgi:predicted TIM-barrel fold metal-dependent hydrolase